MPIKALEYFPRYNGADASAFYFAPFAQLVDISTIAIGAAVAYDSRVSVVEDL